MEMSETESFEFYAVVRKADDLSLELQKIPLSQPAQVSLTTLFDEQRAAFLNLKTELKPFEPTHSPAQGELFEVKDYELPSFLGTALTASQTIEEMKDAFTPQAPIIKGVVAVDQEHQAFYFQAFRPSHILQRRRTFLLSKDNFRQLKKPAVQLDSKLAAVYRDGDLCFKSINVVRQFLPMDDIFAEATKEDVLCVLDNEIFLVDNPNELVDEFSDRAMKYFSLIIHSKILEHPNATPQKIKNASKNFSGVDIQIKKPNGTSKIVFPTDKRQLNYLLKFLAEVFYVSAITKQPRATNSHEKYKPLAAKR